MSEWQPLIYGLITSVFILLVVPGTVNTFYEGAIPAQDGFTNSIVTFVTSGISFTPLSIFGFDATVNINPFSWFGGQGNAIQTYVASVFVSFGFLPSWLSVPLLTIVLLAIVYGIIRMFVPTK